MMWRRLSEAVAFAAVLCVAVFLPACNNGCEETRETYCISSLSSASGASITTLYAWGIGQQSVADTTSATGRADSLMLQEASPEQLYFILRPDMTETRLRLQMTVSGDSTYQVEDTLTLRYEPRTVFLNMDCGCSVFFTLTEAAVTGHFLQSVNIENAEITNTENVNLSLVY